MEAGLICFQGLWQSIVCTWWRTLLTLALKLRQDCSVHKLFDYMSGFTGKALQLSLYYSRRMFPWIVVNRHFLRSSFSADACRFGLRNI